MQMRSDGGSDDGFADIGVGGGDEKAGDGTRAEHLRDGIAGWAGKANGIQMTNEKRRKLLNECSHHICYRMHLHQGQRAVLSIGHDSPLSTSRSYFHFNLFS
jgi:hypothetical protein